MIERAKHELILNNILKDIYNDRFLTPILGLKGGTATYLLYNLLRFSVDLDFNLLNEKEIDKIFKRIKKILEKYGKIKESYQKKNTLFFFYLMKKNYKMLKLKFPLEILVIIMKL